jgi:hypothetical protein
MKPKATTAPASVTPGTTTADEPRNVIVSALKNHTKLGKAIVAAGRVDFPLTKSEADAAVAAGLVTIVGVQF